MKRPDERGDTCERPRCKREAIVHYLANGHDIWLCNRHYGELLGDIWGWKKSPSLPEYRKSLISRGIWHRPLDL